MREIVVRVLDSVCKAHNRDPEALALIEAAKTFGTVETLDQALAAERAKWNAENQKLKASYESELLAVKNQLVAIQEKNVTQEEMIVLQAVRKKSELESAAYEAKIKSRDEQLAQISDECEARRQQIKSMYNL